MHEPEVHFVATKRAMPRVPPGYVDRERLLDLLDGCVDRAALTLIRAPAGTGKTALVSAWAAAGRAPGPVAWLSLAAGDDTRSRFWRQVVLALVEAVDDDSFRIAFSAAVGVDALLVAMVDALATRERPVVLVLDDVHELSDPALMADLNGLLRAPPAGVRIVALARADLPVQVSRLRLSGALAEVGPRDLAFTFEEGVALFHEAGLDLQEGDAQRLWERTEGWVAGLALTALALRGRADPGAFVQEFSGGIAPVADYLLEEVLDDESPAVRDFLVMTSLADAVCGELADAMTGRRGGGAVLASLHQRGVLTVALDDHQRWFRYHGLLAEMLRNVLRREQPDQVAILHARAARWLAANGRVVRGAQHAVAAGDAELLADIAAEHAFALSARGELSDLGVVVALLPEEDVRAKPTLLLTLAGAAMEVGDVPVAARWLERAEQEAAAVPEHRRAAFEMGLALARLYEARLNGNIAGALEGARPFLAPTARSRMRGPEVQAIVLVHLGALELWTGDLQGARAHLAAGVAASESIGQGYLTLYGLGFQSLLESWSEDLNDARRTATRAVALADEHGWRASPRVGIALTVLSYVASEEGDIERAGRLQDEADLTIASGVEVPLRGHSAMHRARLARMRGRPQEARECAAEARAILAGTPFLPPAERFLLVQEALALQDEGARDEGIALLEDVLATHSEGGQVPVGLALLHVEAGDDDRALSLARPWADPDGATMLNVRLNALLICARVEHRRGNARAWRVTVERALALAERHGRYGPFLDHGPQLGQVLADHRRAGTAFGGFIDGLDRGAPAPPLSPAAAASGASPPIEGLSDRELAVLRYLPTVLSNREIADELIVSVNTVKTHVRSIYAKLGAHDRRSAVLRARGLGLIGGMGRR